MNYYYILISKGSYLIFFKIKIIGIHFIFLKGKNIMHFIDKKKFVVTIHCFVEKIFAFFQYFTPIFFLFVVNVSNSN